MKKVVSGVVILFTIFFIVGCTKDNNSSKVEDNEVVSSASISKDTGKWIEKTMKNVDNQIKASNLSTDLSNEWSALYSIAVADMKKEKISEDLRDKLRNFQHNLTADSNQDLNSIKEKIDEIIVKID